MNLHYSTTSSNVTDIPSSTKQNDSIDEGSTSQGNHRKIVIVIVIVIVLIALAVTVAVVIIIMRRNKRMNNQQWEGVSRDDDADKIELA